jgi:hypothetical protein
VYETGYTDTSGLDFLREAGVEVVHLPGDDKEEK